jgi:hypothetical protein
MFHLIPVTGRKTRPPRLPPMFLGQCLVVAIVIMLFVSYVSRLANV